MGCSQSVAVQHQKDEQQGTPVQQGTQQNQQKDEQQDEQQGTVQQGAQQNQQKDEQQGTVQQGAQQNHQAKVNIPSMLSKSLSNPCRSLSLTDRKRLADNLCMPL